ncbi:MAG: hypothetical protein KC589_03765, partial [Nanoarchaeota archaeon]|nr:hypothetical protein [Nanoarchaeota archaeon]
ILDKIDSYKKEGYSFIKYENSNLLNEIEAHQIQNKNRFNRFKNFVLRKELRLSNWGANYAMLLFPHIDSWLSKTKIFIERIFGTSSEIYQECIRYKYNFKLQEVTFRLGLLDLAKDILTDKDAFKNQLITTFSRDLFEEANYYINTEKHKDIGAILLRIILEKNLINLATNHQILHTEKGKKKSLETLNRELFDLGLYNKITKNEIDTIITCIGNTSHHGDFNDYTLEQIKLYYEILYKLFNNKKLKN